MKFKSGILLWLALLLCGSANAQFHQSVPIDSLFKGVAYSNLRISPDGKYFAAGKVQENGQLEAFIIERKTMEVVSSMGFDGRFGVGNVQWANNERVLFEIQYDSALSEGSGGTGMIAAMNIDGTEKKIIWDGETSDYGGREGGALMGKMDKDHYKVMVQPSGSGVAKFPYYYFYKLNIYTGKTERIARSPIRMGKPISKKDGEITHWVGAKPDSFNHTVILAKNNAGGWDETVYDQMKGEFKPVGWDKDGEHMFYQDTIEAPTVGLYRVDVATGEKQLIYRHPKVDYSRLLKDENGNIWGALINYDYPKVVYIDPDNHYAITQKKLEATFPNQVVQIVNKTADNNEWMVHVSSDVHPGKYYLYNQFDGALKFLANQAEWIDPKTIPPTYPYRFSARDGLEINGYITLPLEKQKDVPLIILPHGGPHGPRDYWGFNRERIVFANAGYAVMHVNYRGSGGYGREFLYDWYGHWGLEMQDDLTDATHWAIKEGIADPDRICIYGASYGGYATLMGLVKEPDLYQCGIGYVGVYDLNLMMKKGDVSLRQSGVKYMKMALGDTEEKRRAQSSTPHVDRITKPVFLVHGKRDIRAHWQHYVDMREALLDQDHRLETLEIPRAGHGARKRESQLEIYCRMIDFFDRHIGDRKPWDPADGQCVPEGTDGLPYAYYNAPAAQEG